MSELCIRRVQAVIANSTGWGADVAACSPGVIVDMGQHQTVGHMVLDSLRSWRPQMDDEIRKKILTLLGEHRIMTVATLRPDGWPQATTVGYVNEGLTLYFLCGLDSQKAKNLARDNRISLAIDHDTANLMTITGLSMAAHAHAVDDRAEAEKVLRMLPLKYPEAPPLPVKMPSPDEIRLFRVTPTVISVLDYSKGFGHTDLVTC